MEEYEVICFPEVISGRASKCLFCLPGLKILNERDWLISLISVMVENVPANICAIFKDFLQEGIATGFTARCTTNSQEQA